jgi:hypothetical protein
VSDKSLPKGVQDAGGLDSLLAKLPQGVQCACCGVVNSEDATSCGWCGSKLAAAGPPPAPQLRRVGPDPTNK